MFGAKKFISARSHQWITAHLVRALVLFVAAFWLLVCPQVEADDEVVAKIVPGGGDAPTTLGASVGNPEQLEAYGVNLYTGQHTESFPFLSLPGHNGMGANLSLEYSGVAAINTAKLENRKGQASVVGLGFTLGLPSIVANHMGTADINDDEYYLVGANSPARLYALTDSTYLTENGAPWQITRVIDTVEAIVMVIGWTIVDESGVVLSFGDHSTDPSEWNATRNLLRFGNYVGTGATADDSVYAHQWDLKKMSDTEGDNDLPPINRTR